MFNLLLQFAFPKEVIANEYSAAMKPGDANNAMINATGKNGVNHGVKEPPSREQRHVVRAHFS